MIAKSNMAGWAIGDYELALDAIELMAAAGNGIICQPRAGDDATFYPGAQHVIAMISGLDYQQTDLIGSLKAARYNDPADEGRRLRLILRYELDELPLADLAKLVDKPHA
ncbi:hypothetical protein N8D56_05155 [Devosia sp. A8/3-2]|nr:hypothetical protein N8D56_05155 [Devosia sp. A8/3-2]